MSIPQSIPGTQTLEEHDPVLFDLIEKVTRNAHNRRGGMRRH